MAPETATSRLPIKKYARLPRSLRCPRRVRRIPTHCPCLQPCNRLAGYPPSDSLSNTFAPSRLLGSRRELLGELVQVLPHGHGLFDLTTPPPSSPLRPCDCWPSSACARRCRMPRACTSATSVLRKNGAFLVPAARCRSRPAQSRVYKPAVPAQMAYERKRGTSPSLTVCSGAA